MCLLQVGCVFSCSSCPSAAVCSHVRLWPTTSHNSAAQSLTVACAVAGLLFFELLFLSFRQLFVALFTFPDEFKMLLKERASGMYRLSAFYFARTASDLPMDMAIPTLFLLLVYFMGHLRYTAAAFFANFFTVILIMLVRLHFTLLGWSLSSSLFTLHCQPV